METSNPSIFMPHSLSCKINFPNDSVVESVYLVEVKIFLQTESHCRKKNDGVKLEYFSCAVLLSGVIYIVRFITIKYVKSYISVRQFMLAVKNGTQ